MELIAREAKANGADRPQAKAGAQRLPSRLGRAVHNRLDREPDAGLVRQRHALVRPKQAAGQRGGYVSCHRLILATIHHTRFTIHDIRQYKNLHLHPHAFCLSGIRCFHLGSPVITRHAGVYREIFIEKEFK
jgi:hypothetical protein